jgi:hypothetical protein
MKLKEGKNGRVLKPTKQLYPYDAATGWQDLNIAKVLYEKQRNPVPKKRPE